MCLTSIIIFIKIYKIYSHYIHITSEVYVSILYYYIQYFYFKHFILY